MLPLSASQAPGPLDCFQVSAIDQDLKDESEAVNSRNSESHADQLTPRATPNTAVGCFGPWAGSCHFWPGGARVPDEDKDEAGPRAGCGSLAGSAALSEPWFDWEMEVILPFPRARPPIQCLLMGSGGQTESEDSVTAAARRGTSSTRIFSVALPGCHSAGEKQPVSSPSQLSPTYRAGPPRHSREAWARRR